MFTGIIEEIGSVRKIISIRDGKRICITAQKILSDLKNGDSVAVSGICLTVVQVQKDAFVAEAVGETLIKTTLRHWSTGKKVNLERALQVKDRLGGHLVQGHVNNVARVTQKVKRGENWYLELEIPGEVERYIIAEGSIAVDGISLTLASLNGRKAGISVIPHTYQNTVISAYRIGQPVNIEIDFLARYVEKLFSGGKKKPVAETFSAEWFKNLGY